MEFIDIVNVWMKNLCMNILTYFLVLKIINYNKNNIKKIFQIIIISGINSAIYIFFIQHTNQLVSTVIMYIIFAIAMANIINEQYFFSMILTLISFTITSVVSIISMVLSSIILKITIPNITVENILGLMLTMFLEVIILYGLFRIKRLKNGIPFLKNKEKMDNIGIIGICLIGIMMIIYTTLGTYNNYVVNTYLIIAIIIELICMIIWIRRKITKFYKQKLKEQTIGELTNDLKERDELIDKISRENKALATINHKYSSRIDALENFTRKIAINPELVEKFRTEFGVDFIEIQEQIDTLSKEYSEEVNSVRKFNENISKTGIFGIDNLLEYLKNEAIKNDIKFQLNINENITKFIEEHIPQNKLEILLGDHIKDAIIAIKSSQKLEKEILVKFENSEIHIYDTGIEFEINTLLKLGLEQVTTHKATGGSGIGFMTTFETLKIYKASLEIEEMLEGKYTKVVRIIFDGLNEYRIKTYRKKEIQIQEGSERIKFIE